MENNKDLYVITDTKYDDIFKISIQFEKMTSILKNHTELYERFIIEILNEKMYLYLKEEKQYLFKYYIFALYLRWDFSKGLKDFENILNFTKKNKINAIAMDLNLFNQATIQLLRNYSIPVYLHTVNNIERAVDLIQKGVKGIMTDNLTYDLMDKYLLDTKIKLNQTY